MSDNIIRINLHMADACYPVFINPENEEIVRAAAKQVNTIQMCIRDRYCPLYKACPTDKTVLSNSG